MSGIVNEDSGGIKNHMRRMIEQGHSAANRRRQKRRVLEGSRDAIVNEFVEMINAGTAKNDRASFDKFMSEKHPAQAEQADEIRDQVLSATRASVGGTSESTDDLDSEGVTEVDADAAASKMATKAGKKAGSPEHDKLKAKFKKNMKNVGKKKKKESADDTKAAAEKPDGEADDKKESVREAQGGDVYAFIDDNRDGIVAAIKRAGVDVDPHDTRELRLWVMNDEGLYNWARDWGMNESVDTEPPTTETPPDTDEPPTAREMVENLCKSLREGTVTELSPRRRIGTQTGIPGVASDIDVYSRDTTVGEALRLKPDEWTNWGDISYMDHGGLQVAWDGDNFIDMVEFIAEGATGEGWGYEDGGAELSDWIENWDELEDTYGKLADAPVTAIIWTDTARKISHDESKLDSQSDDDRAQALSDLPYDMVGYYGLGGTGRFVTHEDMGELLRDRYDFMDTWLSSIREDWVGEVDFSDFEISGESVKERRLSQYDRAQFSNSIAAYYEDSDDREDAVDDVEEAFNDTIDAAIEKALISTFRMGDLDI